MTETDRLQHDALILAWQTGRDYVPVGAQEAADDLANAAPLTPPPVPYEQRVVERIADMIRYSPADEYRGGPVAWQPGWAPGAGDPP